MRKPFWALAALFASLSVRAAVTMPSFDDPKYTRAWYAPPPDWVPEADIREYNPNTRAPEVVWVEYKGTYGPGLRIRPIPGEILDVIARQNLCDKAAAKGVLDVAGDAAREKDRTVVVTDLALPHEWASGFTNFSFRVKSDVSGAGAGLSIDVNEVGVFKTSECKDVTREGDVTSYSFPVEPKFRTVRWIRITVDPFEKGAVGGRQEITVFDLHFKMSHPFSLYKALAPRAFVDRSGAEVTNIYEYVSSAPAPDTKDVPVKGWAPTGPAADDGSVSAEVVAMDVGGERRDCLRVTWTRPKDPGRKYSVIRVPLSVDAFEWNTLSFLYKIETPAGMEKCAGLKLSPLLLYYGFDKYIDNPGVSFASDSDCYDWNLCGVTRQHLSQGRREAAGVPAGWKFYACDMLNDDPTGNKWFSMDKITSYEFTLKNSLLAEGQKAVLTVALPRLTRGLVYRGGDMPLYKEFLEWRKNYRPRPYEEALKENPFEKGRLDRPVQVMKNRKARLEIVSNWGARNYIGRKWAAGFLRDELLRLLDPENDIPVFQGKKSTNDVTRLILGYNSACTPRPVSEAWAEFNRTHSGTSAPFVMEYEGDFYFCGAEKNGNVGQERGIFNGILDFLEGNFGLIWPWPARDDDYPSYGSLRPPKIGDDYSFTWGKRWTVPAESGGILNWSNVRLANFNRQAATGCWYDDRAFEMSCGRVWAANHWFGFGRGETENDNWGMRADGTRYKPDCYTGTPCLINIIEDGKKNFFEGLVTRAYSGADCPYEMRYMDDAASCCIEDTWNTCQCPKCLAPFRLPDGTLITKDDPDFKAEAHIVNATAYNQMIRVYLNRKMRLNYLVYFYTTSVPRTPLTRYLGVGYCPYVRNSYDLPIYAPCHDKFWRCASIWAQAACSFCFSDYFIGGFFRPRADVLGKELVALRELGMDSYGQETPDDAAAVPETWVCQRRLYMPGWDADAVRAYYCSKVFGRGAKQMYDFYAKFRRLRYDQTYDTEFEEWKWSELGRAALAAPSSRRGCANLAEELDRLIRKASERTRGDERSHWYIEKIRDFWNFYYENARNPVPTP